MQFQTYQKYKSSGIDWLGEIPDEWEVKRLKEICDIYTGATPSSLNPDYFFDEINWFTPSDFFQIPLKDSKRKISKIAIKDNQAKLFKKKSVLLVSIGATLGKVSYSENIFSCNQQINPLTPNRLINYKYFFYYLYCSTLLIKSFSLETTLAILNQDRSGLIPVFLPNKQTQTAIADYLDQHTALIDKKIELLKTKKQSYTELKKTLINEVVTKGLDETVEMKDSGIEWIGQIPKHWEVIRGKELFKENSKSKITANEGEKIGKYKFFTSSNKQSKWLDYFVMNSESILFSTGGSAGVNYCEKEYSYSTDTWSICGNKKTFLKYFAYYFESILHEINSLGFRGAGLEHLQKDFINLGKTIFPPKPEQIVIANYLDKKTSKIDQIIKKIDENILALQEFRKTLINDVVTGKVKVL